MRLNSKAGRPRKYAQGTQVFSVRLEQDDARYLIRHGGAEYLRELLQRDRTPNQNIVNKTLDEDWAE